MISWKHAEERMCLTKYIVIQIQIQNLANHECGRVYNTADPDAQQKAVTEENLLQPE